MRFALIAEPPTTIHRALEKLYLCRSGPRAVYSESVRRAKPLQAILQLRPVQRTAAHRLLIDTLAASLSGREVALVSCWSVDTLAYPMTMKEAYQKWCFAAV